MTDVSNKIENKIIFNGVIKKFDLRIPKTINKIPTTKEGRPQGEMVLRDSQNCGFIGFKSIKSKVPS